MMLRGEADLKLICIVVNSHDAGLVGGGGGGGGLIIG